MRECALVAGGEVHAIGSFECRPGKVVGGRRAVALPDHRDRPFPLGVEEGHRSALRRITERGMNTNAVPSEIAGYAMSQVVVTERGEEVRSAGELRELHGGHRGATA